jgi:general secretion pathway protein C
MRFRIPASRIASVLLFALLCAVAAYWVLQLVAHRAPVAPAGAVARTQAPVDLAQASRLFGGAPAATTGGQAGDIRVTGVLAAGRQGIALLSINGAPAKAFAVGQEVTAGVRLEAVEPDVVRLAQGASVRELEAPARGSLSVLSSGPVRSSTNAPPVPVTPGAASPQLPALPAFGAAAGPQDGGAPPPGSPVGSPGSATSPPGAPLRSRLGMRPQPAAPGTNPDPGADGMAGATTVTPTPIEPGGRGPMPEAGGPAGSGS